MAHDERVARLRSGEVDLALIDVASFVDTAATDPAFPVPYGQLFGALAAGEIDVAPDFAGIAARYQRALGDNGTAGVLCYRDCGVQAYGTGLVASARALVHRRGEIGAFLSVAAAAYEAMREDPARVLELASLQLPTMDSAYALQEWREEEAAVVFGYEAAERGVGASDSRIWAETAA